MKRRPHWDDDLITAVCATGDDGEVDYWMTSDQVYRIIAAVEDWQDRTQQARAMSMTDNEAAIARVRELHRQSHFSNECIECAPGGTYYWPCPTVEALADGAS